MPSTPRSHKRKISLPPPEQSGQLDLVLRSPSTRAKLQLVPEDAVAAAAAEDEQDSPEDEERQKVWDAFAEEYHDIVIELPLEYQRNFLLLSELEEAQQASTSTLKSSLQAYLLSLSSTPAPASPTASTSAPSYVEDDDGPSSATRLVLGNISKAARAAIRAGEDKVGLTITLYEAVDRHIRRLDADLAKYEDSLIIGLRAGTLPSHDAPSLTLKSPPGRTTSRGAIALGEKEAYLDPESGLGQSDSRRRRGVPTSGVKEERERKMKREERRREKKEREERERGMPVDPNEPTYCFCDEVSYGEMIGCENGDCAREWFHLSCVGLESAPLGKWYCSDCEKALGLGDHKPALKRKHTRGGR